MAAKVALSYEATASPAAAVLHAAAASGVVRSLFDFAIVPEDGDNCAIARTVTPKGTRFTLPGSEEVYELSNTTLEGHRFAIRAIAPGEHLQSWHLTFAQALKPLAVGQYLANWRVLAALRARGITDLPSEPNMEDLIVPHSVAEAEFQPHAQVPEAAEQVTWQGYAREASRGVGTRNYVILVGTTSFTAGYVKALEGRVKAAGLLAGSPAPYPTLDGVVAVPHTEGSGNREEGYRPHNYDLLCGTLNAFLVHPNVGAALVVDYGSNEEAVWAEDMQAAAAASGVPLHATPHHFLRLTGDLEADLALGMQHVLALLPAAAAAVRSTQPASALSIAQQCGGSDAFSGVSGNPCAGEACKLLIANGGQAVLAETDELMGAEAYILSKVKDYATAQKFLGIIDAFKQRLAWHGQSAESNPSGGNNWRGLYNIGLKSLGAAKKKHADVRLDGVLAYGERSQAMGRGYFMMDSPGNDLESIAGQVATGCNVIYFITGNGSITNFPFVPTIKIVTTTERFKLLQKDMDFNAGRYQEGTPMPVLGAELYALTQAVASGQYSVGERAGHFQVSIWRNWPQVGPTDVSKFNYGPKNAPALALAATSAAASATTAAHFPGYPGAAPRGNIATERIGLILPTSLCSGEVARQITAGLNASLAAEPGSSMAARVGRFECLPHTEGCGTGYPEGGIEQYSRIMLGHLTHPSIALALCLEHGCEKTHNDFFTNAMRDAGLPTEAVGFASIQLDGGIEAVSAKVRAYFEGAAAAAVAAAAPHAAAARQPCPVTALDIGLLIGGGERAGTAERAELALAAARLAAALVAGGGNLVLPSNSPLLRNALFTDELQLPAPADPDSPCPIAPTLAFGEAVRRPGSSSSSTGAGATGAPGGVHIMDMPHVKDYSETVTGLAAVGVHAVLVLSFPSKRGTARPTPGHPLVPVLHVGLGAEQGVSGPGADAAFIASVDALYRPAAGSSSAEAGAGLAEAALQAIAAVAGGAAKAKASAAPFFSITRGPTGVST